MVVSGNPGAQLNMQLRKTDEGNIKLLNNMPEPKSSGSKSTTSAFQLEPHDEISDISVPPGKKS
jgi:hypothetical protein